MHLKRLICLLALCAALVAVLLPPAVAAGSSPTLAIDGEPYRAESGVLLLNGVSYVSFRDFSLAIGPGEITWDPASKTAAYQAGGRTLSVTQGDVVLRAGGRCFYLAGGAQIINGRLMVPVRELSKALGATVSWNGQTSHIAIQRGDPPASGEDFYNAEDLKWLSRIIYAESQGQPFTGQVAVGNVILNRVKSSDYPNTIYGVIFDNTYGVQFTPVASGAIYAAPDQTSVEAAKICLEGYTVTARSIYFLNPRKAQNLWVPQNRPFVMRIGEHDFYA